MADTPNNKPQPRKRSFSIAVGVAVIVAVASAIGLWGGRLSKRAPRGGGQRVAAVATDPVVADIAYRSLLARPGTTAVPPAELASRMRVMKLDAAGAAASLEVDATVTAPDPGFPTPTANMGAYRAFVAGDFARATELDPAFGPALLALALADDDGDTAAAALTRARAASATLSPFELLMADARAAWLAGDAEGALAPLRKATVQFPEERDGHFWLGKAYNRLLNAHDEALRHLEAARRLTPDHRPVSLEMSDAWGKLGNRKQARSALKGYLAIVPDDAVARERLAALTRE